jgi:uncharacterized protein YbbC (DUF1343 family)
LFEGTVFSEGRGTLFPFQVYGHPEFQEGTFKFRPTSIDGMSKNPKFKDQDCFGRDLREIEAPRGVDLSFIIEAYRGFDRPDEFFTNYFHLLAGNRELQRQIVEGWDENRIRDSWKSDLAQFLLLKRKYQLYH